MRSTDTRWAGAALGGEIVEGASFTQSAHAAGFFDQAHFAHDFRRTFGAPASISLSKVRV